MSNPEDIAQLGILVDRAHAALSQFGTTGPDLVRNAVSEYDSIVVAAGRLIEDQPRFVLASWPAETLAAYFELAVVLLLAEQPEEAQLARFATLVAQLDLLLQPPKHETATKGVAAFLESMILVVEDVRPLTTIKLLELLARMAGAPEGVIPPTAEAPDSPGQAAEATGLDNDDRARLRDLLQVGLCREVMIFLEQRQTLHGARTTDPSLSSICTPVVSFASRKGGVGKSMLLLATATWFLKCVLPGARVCVIDLDLSGPVWQYLLFPERGRPSHFLNELLLLDQGNQVGEFDFGVVSAADVAPLLEESTIDLQGAHLRLLSIADLPRTSRYLAVAIANNGESFFRFLVSLVTALQGLCDLIVIDNEPGFGTLSLLSHVLATSVPRGCSVVVSTPSLPDLRGSLLELSDLNVLDRSSSLVNRPPLWIINKADAQAREFLATDHSIVEVASQIEAYNDILPVRPVVARALSPARTRFHGLPLPLDPALLAFGNIQNNGTPPLQGALTTFAATAFFTAFVTDVAPRLITHLTERGETCPQPNEPTTDSVGE